MRHFSYAIILALTFATLLSACSGKSPSSGKKEPTTAPSAAAAAVSQSTPARPVIRIHAAMDKPFTDSAGNVWQASTGFKDGETIDRDPNLPIANTSDPAMYRLERYELTKFSLPVLNGKYIVKLYFAETYEDLTGPGQRIFSVKVENVELKDLDIFVKAGGRQRAYIESVPVEVTDAQLDITFTPKEQNTMINALEIVPAS
jgi:hypothetical protein